MPPRDPLTLDMDGDGVETIGLNEGAYFDLDNNGFAEKTSWLGSDDAFVVLDRNSDGVINNGGELFGTETLLESGEYASNGFEALADFDKNQDGQINADDEIFGGLRLWQDKNQDGITDEGELLTLSETGVTSISLGYDSSSYVDEHGTEHREVGTYQRNGETSIASTLWFDSDRRFSVATDVQLEGDIDVSAEIEALPDVQSFGNLYSLHQAMARDESGELQNLVEAFANEQDPAVRNVLITDILFAWTGVTDIDPDSRGSYIDSREIEVLEVIWGEAIEGNQSNPNANFANTLHERFTQFSDTFYLYLTKNDLLEDEFDLTTFSQDPETGEWSGDFSLVATHLINKLLEDPVEGEILYNDYLKAVQGIDPYDLAYSNAFSIEMASLLEGLDQENFDVVAPVVRQGDDEIIGTEEAEVIQGFTGNDTLSGGGGVDVVDGGEGNDQLKGGTGDDTVSGGVGNDYVYGDAGDDTLNGGEGNDRLHGGAGNDTLRGGTGTDTMSGDAGNDTYLFAAGDGNTSINNYDKGTDRNDVIRFLDGVDPSDVVLTRSSTNLLITFQSTGEVITVSNHFNSTAYAVNAIEFADETVWDAAWISEQVLQTTERADEITGYAEAEIFSGLAGNDTISGNDGNDTVSGDEGDDRLYGGNDNDIVSGGDGNDQVYGDAGNDILEGGAGNDQLHGGAGNDTLHGGTGSDTLSGGAGDDTYLFMAGDGDTTISNHDNSAGRNDVLKFSEGIDASDVTATRSNTNLILTVGSTGEVVTIQNYFNSSAYELNAISFSDGTSWDDDAIKLAVLQTTDGDDYIVGYETDDVLDGQAGNDVINGGAGNDTISGGKGTNDYLTGGTGDDVYVFSIGDGNTTINNHDTGAERNDVLRFAEGIDTSDIAFTRSGSNLQITLFSSNEIITIQNYFSSSSYELNAVEFSDGTVWDLSEAIQSGTTVDDILSNGSLSGILSGDSGNDTLNGNGGNDELYGDSGDDVLAGGAGNDTLNGDSGNDSLEGGEGDDNLKGGNGDDVLAGGAGNDTLDGGDGRDRILFGTGDGQDILNTYDPYSRAENTTTLVFGEGIALTDVSLVKSGNNLIVQLNGTDDQITINNWFSSPVYQLDDFEFADGTVYTSAQLMSELPVLSELIGDDVDNSLEGYEGIDSMSGGAGNDTLSGKAGNDALDGGTGNDTLNGDSGNDSLEGGEGDDNLKGGSGDDVLAGGAGNDTLDGGDGRDRILFGTGDGQDILNTYDPYSRSTNTATLVFGEGIALTDVSLVKSGNNLIVQLNGTDDQITINNWFSSPVYQLDDFEFADGTVYTSAQLMSELPVLSELIGDDVDNSLEGYEGIDSMSGGAGNDTLSGKAGNDALDGGTGNDTLNGDSGNDSLEGGEGDDNLKGGSGDDVLAGGAGNDTLDGGDGRDRILFGTGDGQDILNTYDPYSRAENTTTLVFGEGIALTDVSLVKSGNNLIVQLNGTDDQITINNWFSSPVYQLDDFEFADGTVYTSAQLMSELPVISKIDGADSDDTLTGYEGIDSMSGGAGNDTLSGKAGNDALDGGTGNDTLNGDSGNDSLEGGEGDDNLKGGSGDDVLAGGAGNDTLDGGDGRDRILFGTGDGQDILNTYDPYSRSTNTATLVFGEGIALTDVSLVKSGNNLIVQLNGTDDQITINNWFSSPVYQLDDFEFADGTVYTSAQLMSELPVISKIDGADSDDTLTGYEGIDSMSGGAGNDTLSGKAGNDALDGGTGNDTLNGDSGNDSLEGGEGDDNLKGGSGDDVLAGGAGNDTLDGGDGRDRILFGTGDGQDILNTYDPYSRSTNTATLVFGEGIALTDVSLVKSGNNLIVQLNGTDDQITINNWFSSPVYQLDDFEFADGTVYTSAQLMSELPVISKIDGADSDDTLTGYEGIDSMSGGAGNDTLSGKAGNDALDGGTGNDTLNGDSGNDSLEGGEGDDNLKGGSGDDVLAGGAGNDTLDGGDGRDRILFGTGDGQDILNTYDPYSRSTNTATLVFGEGIALTDVSLVKSGDNLIVQLNGTDDQITINNWFSSPVYQLDDFEFADGTVYTSAQLMSELPVISKIDGADSDDTLTGYEGIDSMSGGAGNDTLSGKAGNDALDGGTGNDTLNGDSGNDSLEGGEGDDNLKGGSGDDVLAGGAGNDTLDGGDGRDRILFGTGDGQDILNTYDPYSRAENTTTLVFGEGIALTDVSLVKSGNNLIVQLNGTDDQITINNWFSSPVYQLDDFEFADGTVYTSAQLMSELPVISKIDGADSDDTLTGYEGIDSMSGGAGNDTLSGKAGNDALDGGTGNDTLNGDSGNDSLEGGEGDDNLKGGSGDDVLAGGAGNDTLDGGDGRDRILFGTGDGQDILNTYDPYSRSTNTATLVFGEGIALTDVSLVKSGDNLIVQLNGTDDQITINNWFSSPVYQLDDFEFSDGTNYTTGQFLNELPVQSVPINDDADYTLTGYSGIDAMSGGAGNDTLSGKAGNDALDGGTGNDTLNGDSGNDSLEGGEGDDNLKGGSGDDVLAGGAGNDTLDGGDGRDRILFGTGDGQDILNTYDPYSRSTNTATLVFGEGIALTDVSLVKSGNNLIVQLNGTDDQITINNWFSSPVYQLDDFEFSDGTNYTTGQFLNELPVQSVPINDDADYTLTGYSGIDAMSGGAGNDTLSGKAGNDALDGGTGNDTLNGDSGNDSLEGGEGDDNLKGGSGDDVLAGGAGNDTLDGGDGRDRILFGTGDGQDILNTYDPYSRAENTTTLVFGEGIALTDVSLVKSGNNLIVQLNGTDDQITINNWFSSPVYQLDDFEFSDGTNYTTGQFLNELPVQSVPINDDADYTLTGYSGIDAMSGGAGNDTLSGKAGNDALDGGTGNDTLNGDSGNDSLEGGEGDDNLKGGSGDDVLAGGAGNDTLDGGDGRDRILFGTGDGQDILNTYDPYSRAENTTTLVFGEGIALTDVSLVKSGNNLIVQLNGTDDQITINNWFSSPVYQLDDFEFSDGTNYTTGQFLNELPVQSVPINDDADYTLTGYSGIDAMSGGAGNDTLSGKAGNDALDGGTGNDTLNGDSGNDSLEGGEGDDNLKGGSGDDVLAGGAGNDTLDGGDGRDRILFGTGDGQDILNTYDPYSRSTNTATLVFGEGIALTDVSLVKSGDNLIVQLNGTDDQITINNWFSSPVYQLDDFEFSDGTNYTTGQFLNELPVQSVPINDDADYTLAGYSGIDAMSGGAGNDTLSGKAGNDALDGGTGNDTLNGDSGNDSLEGGEGDDNLKGGSGDDVLAGGAGNDTLDGGDGRDRILFGTGDGQDILNIYDPYSRAENTTTLVFGEGDNSPLSFEELWFSKNNNDLVVSISGTDDQVTVENWYGGTSYQLDSIEVGSSVLLTNQVDQLVSAMATFAVPSGVGTVISQEVKDELQPLLTEAWRKD